MGKIVLFYKYVHIEYPKQIMKWQLALCQELGLKGRILLAHEGVNGTVGGSDEAIEQYKAHTRAHNLFADIDFKESVGCAEDFPRLRVAVRDTIVCLGIDPTQLLPEQGGEHLSPQQVHELLSNKPDDLVILDARNKVETDIGKFTDAVIPNIENFREFPEYIDKNLEQFKDKQVLMYCTGGIRCERATAYLNVKNVAKKVYQIEGGIHRYAEQYPDGFFRGKNYVFDNRIALKVNDDVLSSCALCAVLSDEYINCSNALCNNHVICCTDCKNKYANCCSVACQEQVASQLVPKRPEFGACIQQSTAQQSLSKNKLKS